AFVAAIELDDEARDGVQKHVEPEGASGERPSFALRDEQHGQDQRLGARFVELRRMERDAERRADVGRGERIRERDAPRLHRRLAVTAAVEQTAEATTYVA